MEEWRAIPGCRGLYEVSSEGRVRSLPRRTPHYTGGWVIRGGKVLKGCAQRGYRQVTLTIRGVWRTRRVHTLVALAFIGPRPAGTIVCHRDGKKSNNRRANIRYGSSQSNSDDMKTHGTVVQGERHPQAKLTEASVKKMRQLAATHTYAELSALFGVCEAQVGNVVCWHQWRHVTP